MFLKPFINNLSPVHSLALKNNVKARLDFTETIAKARMIKAEMPDRKSVV